MHTYYVVVEGGRTIRVHADFFEIEDGNLAFFNRGQTRAHHVFNGRGGWRSVEQTK